MSTNAAETEEKEIEVDEAEDEALRKLEVVKSAAEEERSESERRGVEQIL